MNESILLDSTRDVKNNEDVGKDKGSIQVENIRQINEHIGYTFTSEGIKVSEERIRRYLDAIADSNPIHFDSNRVRESVFAEQSGNRILVPGFLTLALFSNGSVIYDALKINEPYEVSLPETGVTKWRAPIFAGSDIVFKLTLKEANDCQIRNREGVTTKWKVVAYAEVEGKMRPCMTTEVILVYSNLNGLPQE